MGRRLHNLTSKGRYSICECKQLYGSLFPVRGILKCHGAILGDEKLS